MKGCLLFFVLVIFAGLLIKYFNKPDEVFEAKISAQANPFRVPVDSSEIIWQRAIHFLEIHHAIIAAGRPVIRDSSIFVPYGTSYEKGSSIKIERKMRGSLVEFTATWWYSREVMVKGGQEIALYMQKGIWRYDQKN